MESQLKVRIVGAYSVPFADQNECDVCHNADWGDVMVEGICGRCLLARNADLLAAAEALLDRLDTMTTEEFHHGGEREQRESLHAEVQKSKLEASK